MLLSYGLIVGVLLPCIRAAAPDMQLVFYEQNLTHCAGNDTSKGIEVSITSVAGHGSACLNLDTFLQYPSGGCGSLTPNNECAVLYTSTGGDLYNANATYDQILYSQLPEASWVKNGSTGLLTLQVYNGPNCTIGSVSGSNIWDCTVAGVCQSVGFPIRSFAVSNPVVPAASSAACVVNNQPLATSTSGAKTTSPGAVWLFASIAAILLVTNG